MANDHVNWQYLADLPWIQAKGYCDAPTMASFLTGYMEGEDYAKPAWESIGIYMAQNNTWPDGSTKWDIENWEVLHTEDPAGLNIFADDQEPGVFNDSNNPDRNCVWVDPVYWGNSLHWIGYHEGHEYWWASVGGDPMASSMSMVMRTPMRGHNSAVYRNGSLVGYRSPDGSISPI